MFLFELMLNRTIHPSIFFTRWTPFVVPGRPEPNLATVGDGCQPVAGSCTHTEGQFSEENMQTSHRKFQFWI